MSTDYKEVRGKRGVLGVILLISRPAKTWRAVAYAIVLAGLTSAALLGAAGSVSAQGQLPEYDFEKYCEQAAQTNDGSNMTEQGCRDQERAARRWLQDTRVSAEIYDYCDSVASMSGGSYFILKACMQHERQARDAKQ
ncbi:hypothetical protein [Rhodovibrio salinarum]|nr:hypothetical protein [Rhodovibrio salinarum]